MKGNIQLQGAKSLASKSRQPGKYTVNYSFQKDGTKVLAMSNGKGGTMTSGMRLGGLQAYHREKNAIRVSLSVYLYVCLQKSSNTCMSYGTETTKHTHTATTAPPNWLQRIETRAKMVAAEKCSCVLFMATSTSNVDAHMFI